MNSCGALSGEQVYSDTKTRPGGEIAQLLAVRVIGEDGENCSSISINKSVIIEMEFEVTTPGYVLLPHFNCFNESGANLFVTLDRDEKWRKVKRKKGIYKSRVTIPGNFFAECTVIVSANLFAINPTIKQFVALDAVAFQVVDSIDGTTSRGDYAGSIPGIVRPAFDWTTEYHSD